MADWKYHIFLPKYFSNQVVDGCHTSFLTSTWQYWANSAAHFAKSSSSSSSGLPFSTRACSPPSAILDWSNFEPPTPWSAVNRAEKNRFETLSVFSSRLIFPSAWISNIYTAKMVCTGAKVSHIILLLHRFIICSFTLSDGGKEFEDAPAHQLSNAVHTARWPQLHRDFFSFRQAHEHHFRRLWWI